MYNRIKMLCERKGISFYQLEKESKLGNGAICKWEVSSPKVDSLARVARVLGVSIDYLVNGPETGIYTEAFRKSVEDAMVLADEKDIQAAGIVEDRMESVARGELTLSFENACEIADQIGVSIDEIVGIKKLAPEDENELRNLILMIRRLDPSRRAKLFELARLFLDDQRKSGRRE